MHRALSPENPGMSSVARLGGTIALTPPSKARPSAPASVMLATNASAPFWTISQPTGIPAYDADFSP